MGKRGTKRKPAEIVPLVRPTAAQLANGSYEQRFITHVETNTKAQAYVSDHDPVERWYRADRLSDTQVAAIDAVRRLWRLAGIEQKVTASYGERIAGYGSSERRALTEIKARQDLHRMQDYFPGTLTTYWQVFENVCRHGQSAGVAGAALGFGSRSAQDRAHTIVCFVADFISSKEGW